MQCFNYQAMGKAFVDENRLAPRPLQDGPAGTEERLIGPEATPCFGMARLTVRTALPDRDRGRCYIAIVVAGRGRLVGGEASLPLAPYSTVFVPAASTHDRYEADPGAPLSVIKCFPPGASR
jgi:hypothetical protein